MGCGASKKGQEERLPTKKPELNPDEKPHDEQNNQQQLTDEDLIDQDDPNNKDQDPKSKKKKPKKATKVGPDDPNNRPPGDPNNLGNLKIQGLNQEPGRRSGFGDISNINDMPEYEARDPNFKFRDGDLSPIDVDNSTIDKADPKRKTRAQGSMNMNSFEREIVARFADNSDQNKAGNGAVAQKQIRVRRLKTSVFNWPDKGTVEIKSVNYKVAYSHDLKGFRTIKSKDSYLTSRLTWEKDEEEDLYEFSIKDEAATELRSGNSTLLNTPQINFQVDRDGKFIGIKDVEKFIDGVYGLQNPGKITATKQKELAKAITAELEKTWKMTAQEWVYVNKIENEELILTKLPKYGKECYLLNKVSTSNDLEMREKLKEKLADEKSYYQIMSSSKMLKDKFKKWELHKDSTNKPPRLDENGKPMLPHRNLKLNFVFTDKDEATTSLTEVSSLRPFITNYNNSKKIVFEVNRDIYLDIEYEARLNIFMWDGIPELQEDDFLIKEIVRFQDACNIALADLIGEISVFPRIPLKMRLENVFAGRKNKNQHGKKHRNRKIDEANEEDEEDNDEEEEGEEEEDEEGYSEGAGGYGSSGNSREHLVQQTPEKIQQQIQQKYQQLQQLQHQPGQNNRSPHEEYKQMR